MATRSGATTRLRIIDAAYEQFYKEGFARSGVDAIAQTANVTKRTLYYHFDSKDALLTAVLDHQHTLVFTRIQRWARRSSDGPAKNNREPFSANSSPAAERPGWKGSGFTRMAMELADLPGHPARAAASRHKAAVEELARGPVCRKRYSQSASAVCTTNDAPHRGLPFPHPDSWRHRASAKAAPRRRPASDQTARRHPKRMNAHDRGQAATAKNIKLEAKTTFVQRYGLRAYPEVTLFVGVDNRQMRVSRSSLL